jgi:hypothetical protein
MRDAIKIIVDDEVLFRKGISFLLGREANMILFLKPQMGGFDFFTTQHQ